MTGEVNTISPIEEKRMIRIRDKGGLLCLVLEVQCLKRYIYFFSKVKGIEKSANSINSILSSHIRQSNIESSKSEELCFSLICLRDIITIRVFSVRKPTKEGRFA